MTKNLHNISAYFKIKQAIVLNRHIVVEMTNDECILMQGHNM